MNTDGHLSNSRNLMNELWICDMKRADDSLNSWYLIYSSNVEDGDVILEVSLQMFAYKIVEKVYS